MFNAASYHTLNKLQLALSLLFSSKLMCSSSNRHLSRKNSCWGGQPSCTVVQRYSAYWAYTSDYILHHECWWQGQNQVLLIHLPRLDRKSRKGSPKRQSYQVAILGGSSEAACLPLFLRNYNIAQKPFWAGTWSHISENQRAYLAILYDNESCKWW